MPATRWAKNSVLNYNFGKFPYSTVVPNYLSHTGAGKVVTIYAPNNFQVGNTITVSGVDTAFNVTNVDGTWTLDSGSNPSILIFTVDSEVTGDTPQTLTGGTVTNDSFGLPSTMYFGFTVISKMDESSVASSILEPSIYGANGYARVGYTNNKTTWGTASNGRLLNAISITFPTATDEWGMLLSVFIADTATDGNLWWWYDLPYPIEVGILSGYTDVVFQPNTILVTT